MARELHNILGSSNWKKASCSSSEFQKEKKKKTYKLEVPYPFALIF